MQIITEFQGDTLGYEEIFNLVQQIRYVISDHIDKNIKWTFRLSSATRQFDQQFFCYLCLLKSKIPKIELTIDATQCENYEALSRISNYLILTYAAYGIQIFQLQTPSGSIDIHKVLQRTIKENKQYNLRTSKSLDRIVFSNKLLPPMAISKISFKWLFEDTVTNEIANLVKHLRNLEKQINAIVDTNKIHEPTNHLLRKTLEKIILLKVKDPTDINLNLFIWMSHIQILDCLKLLPHFLSTNNILITTIADPSEKKIQKPEYQEKNSETINQIATLSPIALLITSALLTKSSQRNGTSIHKQMDEIVAFTQSFVVGLAELAKNIVEHSTEKNGIVSIRVINLNDAQAMQAKHSQIIGQQTQLGAAVANYMDALNLLDNDKISHLLQVNVIDLGQLDIISTTIEMLEKLKARETSNELKRDLLQDIEELRVGRIQLNQLFNPSRIHLIHQAHNSIAQLGLLSFGKLVLANAGMVRITSSSKTLNRQGTILYSCDFKEIISTSIDQGSILPLGTCYYIVLPVGKQKKVKWITHETPPVETVESIGTYEDLFQIRSIDYSTLEPDFELSIDGMTRILIDYSNNPIPSEAIVDKHDAILKIAQDVSQRVARTKNFGGPSIIAINLYAFDILNDSANLYRFIARLKSQYNYNSIICYNSKISTVENLIQICNNFKGDTGIGKFWSKDSMVLFYLSIPANEQITPQPVRNSPEAYFLHLLGGSTYEEYIAINGLLSKHHFVTAPISSFLGLTPTQLEKSIDIAKGNPLFNKFGKLLYFDLLLRHERLTLFEHNARLITNRTITSEAVESPFVSKLERFKIPGSHFRLGSKIHIGDFYYAKRLFQNSYFSLRFAFLLCNEILSIHLKKLNSQPLPQQDNRIRITIFGYGLYSELLVSNVERLLCKKLNELDPEINHDVFDDLESMQRIRKSRINDNVIVIIPISTTLSTTIKVRRRIEQEYIAQDNCDTEIKIIEPFLSVLVVGHKEFENLGTIEKNGFKKIPPGVVRHFGWDEINSAERLINIRAISEEGTANVSHKYLIPLHSEWNSINDCELCFPENPREEKLLLETGRSSVTPSLIFGFPVVLDKNETSFELTLSPALGEKRSMAYLSTKSTLFRHVKRGRNNYLFYFRKEVFFRENAESIRKWLATIRVYMVANDAGGKPRFPFLSSARIYLIAPGTLSNSEFVNLVNEVVFSDSATIIHYETFEDYLENFVHLFEGAFCEADYIFYVDDILATGRTFNEHNDFIKTAIKKISRGRSFDGCISLINRLHRFDEENLLLKLKYIKPDIISTDGIHPNWGCPETERMYYYLKLNNPTLEEPNDRYPLEREREKYELLARISTRGKLKLAFLQKAKKLEPESSATTEIIDIPSDLRLGSSSVLFPEKHLLRLAIVHELYRLFITKGNLSQSKITQIFSEKTSLDKFYILGDQLYVDTPLITAFVNQHSIRRPLFDDILLKTICLPSMVHYYPIRLAAFRWSLELLEDCLNSYKKSYEKFAEKGFISVEELNASSCFKIEQFRKLKFFIRRSVQLKSNFIIRKEALLSIASMFSLFDLELRFPKHRNPNSYLCESPKRLLRQALGKRVQLSQMGVINTENFIKEIVIAFASRLCLASTVSQYLKIKSQLYSEILEFTIQHSSHIYHDILNPLETSLKILNERLLRYSAKTSNADNFTLYYTSQVKELVLGNEAKSIYLEQSISEINKEKVAKQPQFEKLTYNLLIENTDIFRQLDDFLEDVKRNTDPRTISEISTSIMTQFGLEKEGYKLTPALRLLYASSENSFSSFETFRLAFFDFDFSSSVKLLSNSELSLGSSFIAYMSAKEFLRRGSKQPITEAESIRTTLQTVLRLCCMILGIDEGKGGGLISVRYKTYQPQRLNTINDLAFITGIGVISKSIYEFLAKESASGLGEWFWDTIDTYDLELHNSNYVGPSWTIENYEEKQVLSDSSLKAFTDAKFSHLYFSKVVKMDLGIAKDQFSKSSNINQITPRLVPQALILFGEKSKSSPFPPQKLRFYSLLKNALSDFLLLNLENDVIRGFVEGEKIIDALSTTEHGMENHLLNINKMWHKVSQNMKLPKIDRDRYRFNFDAAMGKLKIRTLIRTLDKHGDGSSIAERREIIKKALEESKLKTRTLCAEDIKNIMGAVTNLVLSDTSGGRAMSIEVLINVDSSSQNFTFDFSQEILEIFTYEIAQNAKTSYYEIEYEDRKNFPIVINIGKGRDSEGFDIEFRSYGSINTSDASIVSNAGYIKPHGGMHLIHNLLNSLMMHMSVSSDVEMGRQFFEIRLRLTSFPI